MNNLILTGTTAEYEYFIERVGKSKRITKQETKNLYPRLVKEQQLKESKQSRVWLFGTWYENHNAVKLRDYAYACWVDMIHADNIINQ